MIDRKAYMQNYNSVRREWAKLNGICPTCNDEQARPGMVTCLGCGQADAARYGNKLKDRRANRVRVTAE